MKTIVFDLDGTLLDSAQDIIGSLRIALEQVGVSMSGPIPPTIVGPPVLGMIEKLGLNITDDQKEKVVLLFRKMYDPNPMLLTFPFLGAVELLADLKNDNWKIYFATNKPKYPTEKLIDRFFPNLVDDFCCVDSIEGRKLSKMEMLLELQNNHFPLITRSIMVGDGNTDIIAGRGLGWYTIAVDWGYSAESELVAECPTHYVRDFGEMWQAIMDHCDN